MEQFFWMLFSFMNCSVLTLTLSVFFRLLRSELLMFVKLNLVSSQSLMWSWLHYPYLC